MKKLILFLGILLWFPRVSIGQVKLQIITKSIQKQLSAKGLTQIQITAERADVKVIGWDKTTISFKVNISTKHPNKEVAEKELAYMDFLNQKMGKTYFLRNYLVLKKGQAKPQSNYDAEYIIYVPRNLEVKLSNSFGEVALKGLKASLDLDLKFCQTETLDCEGAAKVKSYFGENTMGKGIKALNLNTDHSTNLVTSHKSGFKGDITYGSLTYSYLPEGQEIVISSKNALIELSSADWKRAGYKLDLKGTSLQIPEALKGLEVYNEKASTMLEIETNSGNLKIK
ncbi:hypothetical protein [uncultured Arcticibacterium sp.]|uniref:hypothetical protein n=1 Tax=uncultured Arcticibacterium sp. TaxID=2173042 RepID=UPI0030F71699